MAAHIKKDDIVEVIAGDYRGSRGKVLRVDPVRGKVVVEGISRIYKHVRPSRQNPHGGRLQIEQPIDISNVLPVCQKTDKPTRVRFKIEPSGKKTRVALEGSEIGIVKKAKS